MCRTALRRRGYAEAGTFIGYQVVPLESNGGPFWKANRTEISYGDAVSQTLSFPVNFTCKD
jgi:hypothetical protein